ncbi:hypothetical protein CRM22_011251 [Opisthorchis felineus]|uniref:Uncharacterized protein n=1 Tax=Opisthorchis felineus TaxID=147828 RepID=A0A4S2JTH0_OPIFE|nr:hypothetical protein CRM22_011251 [Opisthorchis felineus]TGZ39782.1 hypothetical protein CRM22_011251 [Opisthorchis felineus]TGZ39783.1 hypothetical protein CRM22_011251 [Opisthorchis felineus]
MSRFTPSFSIPTSLQPSNFYTSDAKDAVFNFTGVRTIPTIVERSCTYAPVPRGSTLREKRKSESIAPGSEEDVPPLKVYLSETAMSNHFAEMRLSTQDGECPVDTTLDRTSSKALTGADFDDLGLPVDQDTEQPVNGGDDTPVFELSQCLKDHLKEFPPEYPKEKLLRKILQPKPVLDLVPYDPAIVPPSFRDATKEEDEDESTVVPSNNIPIASSAEVMEAEGDSLSLLVSSTGFQPMEL